MNAPAELKLQVERTQRVYCDISVEAEANMRLRCVQMTLEKGRRITRKEYLESLIAEDIAKNCKGASLREVSQRRKSA